MSFGSTGSAIITTLYTIAVGAIGAAIGYWLSFPVFILIGPAVLISALGLFGIRFQIIDTVRDAAFLLIGIGVGTGINSDATAAFLRWPLAFAALAVTLAITLVSCRYLLVRFFGFDTRSAVLAATPGHLSYVLGIGTALDLNIANIAVVQSVRLLALTLIVPFIAIAFGIEVGPNVLPTGVSMQNTHLVTLIAASLVLGLILKCFKVPAPLLIGGLLTSSLSHVTDITPGVLSPTLALPCFLIMGTLIGTRFSGVTMAQLRAALFAGLATTLVAVFFAILAAIPVAAVLVLPSAHVVVAFAPGGLETMIAMGAVLGANPGFVVACHVGRLLLLTLLVPLLLGRTQKQPI